MPTVTDYLASINRTYAIGPEQILISVGGSIVALLTVTGNFVVILSILLFHFLRSRTNFILLSLATADILIGCVVVPIALVYELKGYWPFSQQFCLGWISLEITCTTSSILHLAAVCVDRYIAIEFPLRYTTFMSTPKLVITLIIMWAVSLCFAMVPIQMGWNAVDHNIGPALTQSQCFFINNAAYAVTTALMIFYIPLAIMVILYVKIFRVAWQQNRKVHAMNNILSVVVSTSMECSIELTNTAEAFPNRINSLSIGNSTSVRKLKRNNYKAARTLGIVMGCFCLCWFPFFVIYAVHPFWPSFVKSKEISKFCIWLGYCNSMMNPIIYAFNVEFRKAFRKIFCHHCCKSVKVASRSIAS